MKHNIRLVECKRTNGAYEEIRNRHYIPNNGAIGQQIHYLIYVDSQIAGIISGGAAAYAVACRDDFFGIKKENRNTALNSIIDNTVFRLERNEPNLGTQILSLWRKRVAKDWQERYGVEAAGFETFIIQTETRNGAMYRADNWTFCGETAGSTKKHLHGIENQSQRITVGKKLVFCKWIKGKHLATEYYSTWRGKAELQGQKSVWELI